MDSATTHPTAREEFQWVADRLPWRLKELLRKREIPVPLDPKLAEPPLHVCRR